MKRNRSYYYHYNKEKEYDISHIDPDVYGHKKKSIKKITQRIEQENDENFIDDLDDQLIPSDTITTAQYLINQLMFQPNDKKKYENKKMPKVCLLHQIYSLLKNNTAVDREMVNIYIYI